MWVNCFFSERFFDRSTYERARIDGHHYNYQTRIIYTPLSIILVRFLLHYAQTVCIFEPASRSLSSFTMVYCEMCAKLLPPILVYLYVRLWLHRLPKAQTWRALKPQGKIEFSVGGLALVSFFTGSGRLSSDFHGGVLQPRFFMWYRLTRYHGIPLHILGFQAFARYTLV